MHTTLNMKNKNLVHQALPKQLTCNAQTSPYNYQTPTSNQQGKPFGLRFQTQESVRLH